MMPALYWHKACPGMYYLRDRPFGDPKAQIVAKSISRVGKSYLNTVELEGACPPTGWGFVPGSAMLYTEDEVRRLLPDASFIRENF